MYKNPQAKEYPQNEPITKRVRNQMQSNEKSELAPSYKLTK